jgi:glycosyltransferase involved in cell wall biosynthesis
MTCYDCAPYIDSAIRSVLDQAHGNLELIAVDDASRDNTWERLEAAAAMDDRVRAIRLQGNVGTYAAKNVGLALAQGEYLAFQDADDWSCPERFSRCMELLRRRPWVEAVVCEYVRLQDDGHFWSSLVWPLQRRTPNSVLFRRRVLARLGFFDEHRFGSDSEFVARLQAAFGPRALYRLAQPLIVAAKRDNSLMTAPSTGLDTLGRSQARADFQEAWTEQLLRRALGGESFHRSAQRGTPALIAEVCSNLQ